MAWRQWSYSSISNYEKCPYRYYLAKIEEHPDEPGAAAQRGKRVHDGIEQYLLHEIDDLPEEASDSFGEELERAREKGVEAELEFAYDDHWLSVPWDDAWVRGKMDMVLRDEDIIVDFKTGRYYPTHIEQASLYALAAMIGDVTKDAYVEFWYLDQNDIVSWEFPRTELQSLKTVWESRAQKLQDEEDWAPKPGAHCRWCAFSQRRGGQCLEG